MTGAVKSEERAFVPTSGHRALDLLATLRDRHSAATECLRTPADLDRWLERAGLAPGVHATGGDLEAARELREALNGIVRATIRGSEPRPADVATLNGRAARPALAPQLGPDLAPRRAGGVEAALAQLAREAVELLTGPERALIRECAAAPRCSRLYIDRSPGRRRRWCRMEWCGSSAKMREYRRRRAGRA